MAIEADIIEWSKSSAHLFLKSSQAERTSNAIGLHSMSYVQVPPHRLSASAICMDVTLCHAWTWHSGDETRLQKLFTVQGFNYPAVLVGVKPTLETVRGQGLMNPGRRPLVVHLAYSHALQIYMQYSADTDRKCCSAWSLPSPPIKESRPARESGWWKEKTVLVRESRTVKT